ncbi:MAG: glycosyltransferase family A protein [Candidatus Kapabacteria bacterium]|nr:glycosyltransferase family A protein [Candidatus Kapabacteria bacterium]
MIKDSSINKKLIDFYHRHKDIPLPERESEFLPEVLIPCYNHGKFLESALKSIPKDISITIINDSSTDNTLEIIQELKSKYSFKLINNETNLLQYASINKAINLSANNLFYILNADDILLPDWIQYSLNILKENSSIYMVGGQGIGFRNENVPDSEIISDKQKIPLSYRIYCQEEIYKINNIRYFKLAFSGTAFLRSSWNHIGGLFPFSKRVCSADDRDFQMRMLCFFNILISDKVSSLLRTDSSTQAGQI